MKNHDQNKIEYYRRMVFDNAMSLRDIKKDDSSLYIDDYDELRKLRNLYLLMNKNYPRFKSNFFIFGDNVQKNILFSKAIARSICEDDFYEIEKQDKAVAFKNYDGQKAIIYNNVDNDWIAEFFDKDSSLLLKYFEIFPDKQFRFMDRDTEIAVCNSISIANSTQDFNSFIEGLKDYHICHNMFNYIVHVKEDCFDFYVNKDMLFQYESKGDSCEYILYKNILGNINEIAMLDCENRYALEKKLLEPVIDVFNEVKEKIAFHFSSKDKANKISRLLESRTLTTEVINFKEA